MTPAEQLEKWVAGESIHNEERKECTPDFSCCYPDLAWLPWERKAFQTAWLSGDQDAIDKCMVSSLMMLLAHSAKLNGVKVIPVRIHRVNDIRNVGMEAIPRDKLN
jgi:hypothetical protein